ncbi:hypothetical protein WJX79_000149 [Trebouxia sp. C0005]
MVPTEDCTKMYSSSLKRSRSPELKLAQLRKASGHDDVLTDNLRSQKRYLSQAMATDIDKLNMTPSPATSFPAVHANLKAPASVSIGIA